MLARWTNNCAWSRTSGLKSQAACDVYVVFSCSIISVAQDNSIVIQIAGDIEVSDQTYAYLPTEAVKKLISLYKDNEQDMENPLKKKKDVWKKVTKELNEAGYLLTQNKVECKWRNLLQSHKDIFRDNTNQTGQPLKGETFNTMKRLRTL